MKPICEYQGQFLEWDDDIGENETLKCTFFTDEGEWDEYCYCNEEERDDCKLYKYSKYIKEKDKEIDRLNNILDELEKDIKNLYTYGIKNNAEQRDYLLNRLEGLKELKENK